MGSRRYYVEPEDRDILSVFEDKSKNGRVRKIRKETILKYFSITRCEPRRGIERSTVNLILTRRETFRETCHELQTFSSPIIHYSFSLSSLILFLFLLSFFLVISNYPIENILKTESTILFKTYFSYFVLLKYSPSPKKRL